MYSMYYSSNLLEKTLLLDRQTKHTYLQFLITIIIWPFSEIITESSVLVQGVESLFPYFFSLIIIKGEK